MRLGFGLLSLGLLAATAVAQDATPTSGGDNDLSELIDKINDMVDKLPPGPTNIEIPTCFPEITFFDDVGEPPESLLQVLITAIPPSVLPQLIMPSGRSSLLSEFQDGNTPSWYNELPTDIQSYFSAVAAKMTDEGVTIPTSVDLEFPTDLGNDGEGGGEGTSTSSGLGARPTGAIAGSLAVAAGILGAAIAL